MVKKTIVMILILLTFIVGISGCTTKSATNGTFGEKSVSINSIFISNNTTADTYNDSDNGSEYYYIDGYLVNNNSNDAFHVKVNATAYDVNGTVVATNDSAYLNPTTIPAKGVSEFYMDFPDPNNNIVRYDVKVVYATGTFS
jgi:uncharacterized membrane protein